MESLGSGTAAYLCKLTHSAANRGIMYFNTEFSTKHAPHEATDILLRMYGSKQETKGRIRIGRDKLARISSGWWGFADRNQLCEGDICCFAITRADSVTWLTIMLLSRDSSGTAQ